VKTVRIAFLLLLAVLLPVRGAVAAAMLCPAGSAGPQNELHVQDHSSGHDTVTHHHHAGSEQAHDPGGHHGAGADKCNVCSAFCSLTPLVGPPPLLAEPMGFTLIKFSDHSAPPSDFFSDGQERPPRTI
jgi:hypothetical protein